MAPKAQNPSFFKLNLNFCVDPLRSRSFTENHSQTWVMSSVFMPEDVLVHPSWLHQAWIWSRHSTGYRPSLAVYTPPAIQQTHSYIWLWCVWISPSASFSSSSICAGNLSYEPFSSEAQEHLELRTETQDNTVKASCSSLIAHSSIPTISNLSPYLLSFIAGAWRALDSWEKCPKLGLTWAMLAISAYLQLPPEAGPPRLRNVPVSFWI